MKDESASSTPYKLQITLDHDAMKTMDKLRTAMGPQATNADVIRHALGLLEWSRRQRDAGYSVGTIRGMRAIAEVVLPFEPASGSDEDSSPPAGLAAFHPEPA